MIDVSKIGSNTYTKTVVNQVQNSSLGEKLTKETIDQGTKALKDQISNFGSNSNSNSNSLLDQAKSYVSNSPVVSSLKEAAGSFLTGVKNATIGKVEEADALPDILTEINNAYILKFIIKKDAVQKEDYKCLIINAFCPDAIKLSFSNEYEHPFQMIMNLNSDLLNFGVQMFSGKSTIRKLNELNMWAGSKPLSATVELQLYATHSVTEQDIQANQEGTQYGGKLTPIRLMKLLQELASLAQPSQKTNNSLSFLEPPGPAPIVIKSKAVKTREVKNSTTGKTNVEIVKLKDGSEATKIEYTRSGTNVSLQYGSLLRISNVLIKSVDIDIPYVMTYNKEKDQQVTNSTENKVKEAVANREPNKSDKANADARVDKATQEKAKTEAKVQTCQKNYDTAKENTVSAQQEKTKTEAEVKDAKDNNDKAIQYNNEAKKNEASAKSNFEEKTKVSGQANKAFNEATEAVNNATNNYNTAMTHQNSIANEIDNNNKVYEKATSDYKKLENDIQLTIEEINRREEALSKAVDKERVSAEKLFNTMNNYYEKANAAKIAEQNLKASQQASIKANNALNINSNSLINNTNIIKQFSLF